MALHAGAFVFWIGALPGLAESATARRDALVRRLRRFSWLATPAVALLIATGAAIAAVQLRTPSALVGTPHGQLLTFKLVAFDLLLGLAAANRWWLTPAIAAGGSPVRFQRSAQVEIALGLLVLGLASGFRLVPPPRAEVSAPAEAHVHLHGSTLMANVTLRPGRQGANNVTVKLHPTTGAAVHPKEVRIAFADPLRGVEPIRLTARGEGSAWLAGPLLLPHDGLWTVALEVLVSDFREERLRSEVTFDDERPGSVGK